MRWQWRIITGATALCVGMGIGWFVPGEEPARSAMTVIPAEGPVARHTGRPSLIDLISRDDASPVVRPDERVDNALDGVTDDGLLHAARMLRRVGRWNWDDQPHDLILRELALTAQQGSIVALEGVESLVRSAPDDVSIDALLAVCQHLLERDAADEQRLGLELACHVVTADDADRLAELDLAPLPTPDLHYGDDEREEIDDADAVTIELHRLWWLARAWGSNSERHRKIAEAFTPDASTPPAVLEAQLFFLVRHMPDDAGPLLDWMEHASPELRDRLPMAHLLRYSTDNAAWRTIRRLDRAGDAAAGNLVQKRSGRREQRAARRIANDAQAEPSLRRLAAWRLSSPGDDLLDELLELDPKGPSGAVYETVLLADRHLSRQTAADRAEQWLQRGDDDLTRTGALLAALLGGHEDLIDELIASEPPDGDRRALDMARLMLSGSHDPAARDRIRLKLAPDADDPAVLDPDAAMALLATGDTHALEVLTVMPADADRFAIQRRAWLIQRFLPHWHDAMGRPIGGDPHGVRLHFDALRARLWLDRRLLDFDHERRVFTLDDS